MCPLFSVHECFLLFSCRSHYYANCKRHANTHGRPLALLVVTCDLCPCEPCCGSFFIHSSFLCVLLLLLLLLLLLRCRWARSVPHMAVDYFYTPSPSPHVWPPPLLLWCLASSPVLVMLLFIFLLLIGLRCFPCLPGPARLSSLSPCHLSTCPVHLKQMHSLAHLKVTSGFLGVLSGVFGESCMLRVSKHRGPLELHWSRR